MTLQRIKQYPYLIAKIERIKKEIDKLKGDWAVSGAIMASRKSPPYNMREIIVGDRDITKQAAALIAEKRKELDAAIFDKGEIEEFIRNIADLRIKEILTMRYLNGDSWKEVAACFGPRESEGGIKMAVKRFF